MNNGIESPSNCERVIAAAKSAIVNAGWRIDEEYLKGDKCYLALEKDGKHKGWGMFDRLYCWTDAYETITGNPWTALLAVCRAG